jgi:AcrR family transcriptional regulator
LLVTDVNEALPGGSSLLRNEPVQARSTARLTGLLDAAASIIDEIGYERLTTAMVAERAGASIGTVYRYFPDRIAVVDALALRCTQRLVAGVGAAVSAEGVDDWRQALDAVIDTEVAMYRSEPGFRAVSFSDAPDLGADGGVPAVHPLAESLSALLADRFGVVRDEASDLAVQVVVEIGDALLARAFVAGGDGDQRFVDECRRAVRGYLEPILTVA